MARFRWTWPTIIDVDRCWWFESANFIDFAVEQGWFDPDEGKPFNPDLIYGTGSERYPRTELVEELEAAAPVTLREMLDAVRDPRISLDTTGYGQVAHLRPDVRPELRTVWVAPTGSVTAPFVPWRTTFDFISFFST